MSCECKNFETIEEFSSIDEFDRFKNCMEELLKKPSFKEIEVQKPYSIASFDEKWIQCECGAIWRLVYPDFPFKGVFEPVDTPT